MSLKGHKYKWCECFLQAILRNVLGDLSQSGLGNDVSTNDAN